MAHTIKNPSFENWAIDPSEGGFLPVDWVKSCAGSGNAELVTNADFATDLTGWTAAAGWSFDEDSGGAIHDGGISDTTDLKQNISITDEKEYTLIVRVHGMTAGKLTPDCENIDEVGALYDIEEDGTWIYTITGSATDATSMLKLTPTATFDGVVDYVSVRRNDFSDIKPSGDHATCAPFPSLRGADFGIDATPNACTLLGVATLVEGYEYHFKLFHKWYHEDPDITEPNEVSGGVAHIPTVTIKTSDSGHYLQSDLTWSASPYAFPITMKSLGDIFSKRFTASPAGHTSFHVLISSGDMQGNSNGKEHCVFDDCHLEDVTDQA